MVMRESRPPAMPAADPVRLSDRVLVAVLPLSTGAAVLLTLTVVPDSLLWPTVVLVAGGALSATVGVRRIDPGRRQLIAQRLRTGVVAGCAATAAYDVARLAVAALGGTPSRPFVPVRLFGALLLGPDSSRPWQWSAGIAFHALNGLGFAIAYALVVSRPTVVAAVGWALLLETFTITLYPRWLGVGFSELFSVSLIGHLAYGVVLGVTTMRSLQAPRQSDVAS
jgi:hypothetical protein